MATRATIRFQDGEDREHAVAIQKWCDGDVETVREDIQGAINEAVFSGRHVQADMLASSMIAFSAYDRKAEMAYHVMHVDAEPNNDNEFRVICFGASGRPPRVLRYDRDEGCEVECSDPFAPQAQGVAG